ncbi:MAG TPA: Crp/Fnr family transcriptional regulator [Polyangiaceae bacterium]|jgi:CRP-like cAMP-binding protein
MNDPLFARFGREYRAGEVLFMEGDTGEEMYVIQSGSVQVSKRIGDEERALAVLGRGDFLGEMAILNGKPRTASAIVLEDAKCLVIDGKTLETMISKSPEIAMRLVKKLAARLDSADALVQILLNPDPRARVLLGLKRHIEVSGKRTDAGIKVNVTPEELAHEVGIVEEDVHDVLDRLRRLRIAREERGAGGKLAIVILDMGRLLEFMEFLEMPRKFT